MHKRFVAITNVVVALTVTVAGAQDDSEIPAAKAKPSVFSVTTYDEGGNIFARGTGFFINTSGLFVTRGRVLAEGWNRAEIRTLDGMNYRVWKISVRDPRYDIVLAVADVPKKIVRPLPVAAEPPQAGEPVMVISADSEQGLMVLQCSVAGVEDSEWGKVIRVAGSLRPGSNGNPVINRKGESSAWLPF